MLEQLNGLGLHVHRSLGGGIGQVVRATSESRICKTDDCFRLKLKNPRPNTAGPSPIERLSPRELEAVSELAKGRTTAAVATGMAITAGTLNAVMSSARMHADVWTTSQLLYEFGKWVALRDDTGQ